MFESNLLKESFEDEISPLDPSFFLNYSRYQVKNILCGSKFRSVFQFSSDYSHLHEEMTKKKLKTVSLVTTVPLFNLTEPSLNEPVKTLEVQQLRIRILKNVSCTLNFSSSIYETILRYALNLQTLLIWRKWLIGHKVVAIPLTSPS